MALAFVGHSKLVVLDEPTSGIDPAARSAMWEVISNNRSSRTILLTTHHLDEAETLADRVAVLHKVLSEVRTHTHTHTHTVLWWYMYNNA